MIESLPLELRREIVKHVLDTNTLRTLVHASPVFYHQYRQDRDGIWTQLTLQTLTNDDMRLLDEPVPCMHVSMYHGDQVYSDAEWDLVHQTVLKGFRQMRSGASIKLTVWECKALLKITDCITWKLGKSSDTSTEDQDVLLCSRVNLEAFREPKYWIGDRATGWRASLNMGLSFCDSIYIYPRYIMLGFGTEFGPCVAVYKKHHKLSSLVVEFIPFDGWMKLGEKPPWKV